jgi:hypothetical protein
VDDNIINLHNTNVKNVLRHFIIHEICETVINCNISGHKVIYHVLPLNLSRRYVTMVAEVDMEQLEGLVMRILKDIGKHLPIILHQGTCSFEEFKQLLEGNESGEKIEHINKVISTINAFDATDYNFGNIKKYATKYRLNFLSNEYFSQLRTKKLFYPR